MKAYKEYMDSVHVSPALHNRVIAKLNSRKKAYWNPGRFTAVAACLALLLASVWGLSQLGIQGGIAPAPHQEVALLDGTLHFNSVRSIGLELNKSRLSGYFQEAIKETLLEQIFGPRLASEEYQLKSAIAGFDASGNLVDMLIIYAAQGQQIRVMCALGADTVPGDFATSKIRGTEIRAGYWHQGEDTVVFGAQFCREGATWFIEAENSQELLTEVMAEVLSLDLDLSRVVPDSIPEWRYDQLSLNQAKDDAEFGSFVPKFVPSGFSFASAYWITSDNRDQVRLTYDSGMDYIELSIQHASGIEDRIVDITKQETYDLSLYTIPWVDSVPEEIREIVTNPVFLYSDFSMEILRARSYSVKETGDSEGYRFSFSILSGDTVVDITAKGTTAEALYSMLQSMDGLR